jgi:hypothetical protein
VFLSYRGPKFKAQVLPFSAAAMKTVTYAWYTDNIAHLSKDEWTDILNEAEPFIITETEDPVASGRRQSGMTENGVWAIVPPR